VIVKLLVVVRLLIATREKPFDVRQEFRIHRHKIFEMPVLRTILDHPHLAVPLDDLCLDLADLLINKRRYIAIAIDDRLARLDHTVRAKRIRLPRKSQRWLRLLPRFQDRLIRPLRNERCVRLELVNRADSVKRSRRYVCKALFKVLDRSRHKNSLLH